MEQNNNWLILAIVGGVAVMLYMQQQKTPVKQENFTQGDPNIQGFISSAMIYMTQNPKFEGNMRNWIMSMVTDKPRPGVFSISREQLGIWESNHREFTNNFRAAGFR